LKKALAFVFILSQFVLAQVNSELIKFYPLEDGNVWQYENIHGMTPHRIGWRGTSVCGDTILASGFIYKIIKGVYCSDAYERIDTNSCIVYRFLPEFNEEWQLFNLKAQLGDTVLILNEKFVCYENTSEIKKFREARYGENVYDLTRNIGITRDGFIGGPPVNYYRIYYAKTEYTEYGSPFLPVENCVSNISTKTYPKLIHSFQLYQNFPNPFNHVTHIKYTLPQDMPVRLKIYDIFGREIKTLADEIQQAGVKSITWDGKDNRGIDLASGIYIYQMKANDVIQSRKMVYLK